jgi:hypothetical protein
LTVSSSTLRALDHTAADLRFGLGESKQPGKSLDRDGTMVLRADDRDDGAGEPAFQLVDAVAQRRDLNRERPRPAWPSAKTTASSPLSMFSCSSLLAKAEIIVDKCSVFAVAKDILHALRARDVRRSI